MESVKSAKQFAIISALITLFFFIVFLICIGINPALTEASVLILFTAVFGILIGFPVTIIATVIYLMKKSNYKMNVEQIIAEKQNNNLAEPTTLSRNEQINLDVVKYEGSGMINGLIAANCIIAMAVILLMVHIIGYKYQQSSVWEKLYLGSFALDFIIITFGIMFAQYRKKVELGLIKKRKAMSTKTLATILAIIPLLTVMVLFVIFIMIQA